MEDPDYYTYLCSRLTLQNKSLGFFKDLLDKVLPFVSLQKFITCNTDLERIVFCAQNCWNLIGAELIFKGKDPEISLAKRLEGNSAFEKREYQKALLFYSQSIIRAPIGHDLALTYANRSALLKNMGEWEFSINDIKMALSQGYPEENWHILYERMATCHLNLNNYSQAKISINLTKQFATKYASANEKLNKRIQKLSQKIEAAVNSFKEEITNNQTINSLEKNERCEKTSVMFPSFSNKVGVRYSVEQGRFAFAKEEILTCDRVLEEKPYAACLLPERMGSWCLHCFTRLRAPIACDLCANVAFCSKSCKQKGETYHRYECRILALLIGSGMSIVCHLALRIITQSSADFFLEKFESLSSEPQKINLNGEKKYESFDYPTIYNLSALESERKPQDFLERAIMAVFLMKCLRIVGYYELNLFKNPDPTLEELKIGSLLLRHLQIIQFNAYEIHEFIKPTQDNFRKVSSINLGLGLYPTAAFLNHSCAPNITRYFNGTTLLIDSLERIDSGMSIFDNYGPIFTKILKGERQHKLHGRYWFQCTCLACREDWPVLEKMTLEFSPIDDEEKEALKELEILEESYYSKALKLMDEGNGPSAIELLSIYLDLSSPLLSALSLANKPFKTFQLAQEALKLCLPERGLKTSIQTK